MGFTDIHCHLLPGVDDGAQSMEETKELLRIARQDGIDCIAFTPHVRRPWLDRPWSKVERAFEEVKCYCGEKYPELELYLGSEFAYSGSLLRESPGQLHDMNGSGILLTEFKPYDRFEVVCDGIQQVKMAGYDVLIAHIERYACICENIERARRVAQLGVLIQVNADDITHPQGWGMRRFLKKMIRERLIDVVGTDAHDSKRRRPEMSKAFRIVAKLTDEEYAQRIFSENGKKILNRGK